MKRIVSMFMLALSMCLACQVTYAQDLRPAFLLTGALHMADNVRALDPTRLISAALLGERRKVGGEDVTAIDDPLVDKLDVLAVNTYAGWYGDDKLADLPGLKWQLPAGRPLVLSEFGADALAGYREDGQKKFTEQYQAEYYRQTLAMAEKIPALSGLSPWILKGFQSPRREHPVFQNGWNRKGILSETGVRKQAFGVLADYYRSRAKTAASEPN